MKVFRLLGAALLAMLAFGVLTAISASAATFLLAEWLLNGNPVTAELLVETTGELLLEDLKTTIGAVGVKECSGILDGWVGPNSLNFITEVLTLSGTAVKELVAAEAVTCKEETGSCPTPLVWAENLPWESEAELMEDPAGTIFFADLLLPKAPNTEIGWEVECMGIIPLVDSCLTTEGVAELTLEGTSLLGNFSEAFTLLAGAKLALCSQSNEESGVVEGGGVIKPDSTEELTASSETSTA